MKFKFALLSLIVFFVCTGLNAQNELNPYKYILVQKQYEFQKSEDSYQVNSLLVFLFKRAGFDAMFTNDGIPKDLAQNPCLSLKAILKNQPGFLNTKMNIDLVDCQGRTVFSTTLARTKEKDYKTAYHEIIRKTFEDIENLNYAYDGSSAKSIQTPEKAIEKPVSETQPEQIKKVVVKTEEQENPIKKTEIKAAETTKMIKLKPAKKVAEEKAEVKKEVEVKTITPIKITPPKKVDKKPVQTKVKMTLSGKFDFGKWGVCEVSGDGVEYTVTGGTENFVFAMLHTTSKPNIFILKWTAFKKPELAELNASGDLLVDTADGVITYKRVD